MVSSLSRFAAFILLGSVIPVLMAQSDGVPGFEGQWKPAKAIRAGQELDAEHLAKVTVSIKGNSIAISEPGKTEKASFSDAKPGNPGTINLVTERDGTSVVLEGIFELKGDELALCFSKLSEKGTRPKSFEAPSDSVTLLRLKRVK